MSAQASGSAARPWLRAPPARANSWTLARASAPPCRPWSSSRWARRRRCRRGCGPRCGPRGRPRCGACAPPAMPPPHPPSPVAPQPLATRTATALPAPAVICPGLLRARSSHRGSRMGPHTRRRLGGSGPVAVRAITLCRSPALLRCPFRRLPCHTMLQDLPRMRMSLVHAAAARGVELQWRMLPRSQAPLQAMWLQGRACVCDMACTVTPVE